MKTHLFAPLAVFLLFLLCALATGSYLLLIPSVLILVIIFFSAVSVFTVAGTLNVFVELNNPSVLRGEEVRITLFARHKGILPVAPILLELAGAPVLPEQEIRLRDMPGKQQSLVLAFRASHIGPFPVGIRSMVVEDLFGLFSVRHSARNALFDLLVLPQRFATEDLVMASGDPGSEMMALASEDLSAPSDFRSYQAGDPMKKIHWKLSLRKGDLIVRRYEEPVLQEVLILMDCSRPPTWGHPEAEPDIRDALIETAASVYADQCHTDRTVRLPLPGKHPVDVDQRISFPLAMENLARVDFSQPDKFEQVLIMESANLRKVGCLVVISARLNSAMVDLMDRMHRMGPNIRLYLITWAPDDPHVLPLIGRLQHSGIQVSYVKPDKA